MGQLAPGSGEGQNTRRVRGGAEVSVKSSAGVPGIVVLNGLGFVVSAIRSLMSASLGTLPLTDYRPLESAHKLEEYRYTGPHRVNAMASFNQ